MDNDQETEIRPVSALFAQAEPQNDQAPKSRNVLHVGGGKTSRTPGSVLQKAGLNCERGPKDVIGPAKVTRYSNALDLNLEAARRFCPEKGIAKLELFWFCSDGQVQQGSDVNRYPEG
jgi:hypothetical protein